jgi:hypothetical protein
MRGTARSLLLDWTGRGCACGGEYAINANEEAIRLDPSIPSLAVGNPLPTDPQTGGDGLWTGAIDGGYALRIGGALNSAPQLLYNGASGRLAFRSTTGTEMIVLDVDGSAYFGGPMTIATGRRDMAGNRHVCQSHDRAKALQLLAAWGG